MNHPCNFEPSSSFPSGPTAASAVAANQGIIDRQNEHDKVPCQRRQHQDQDDSFHFSDPEFSLHVKRGDRHRKNQSTSNKTQLNRSSSKPKDGAGNGDCSRSHRRRRSSINTQSNASGRDHRRSISRSRSNRHDSPRGDEIMMMMMQGNNNVAPTPPLSPLQQQLEEIISCQKPLLDRKDDEKPRHDETRNKFNHHHQRRGSDSILMLTAARQNRGTLSPSSASSLTSPSGTTRQSSDRSRSRSTTRSALSSSDPAWVPVATCPYTRQPSCSGSRSRSHSTTRGSFSSSTLQGEQGVSLLGMTPSAATRRSRSRSRSRSVTRRRPSCQEEKVVSSLDMTPSTDPRSRSHSRSQTATRGSSSSSSLPQAEQNKGKTKRHVVPASTTTVNGGVDQMWQHFKNQTKEQRARYMARMLQELQQKHEFILLSLEEQQQRNRQLEQKQDKEHFVEVSNSPKSARRSSSFSLPFRKSGLFNELKNRHSQMLSNRRTNSPDASQRRRSGFLFRELKDKHQAEMTMLTNQSYREFSLNPSSTKQQLKQQKQREPEKVPTRRNSPTRVRFLDELKKKQKVILETKQRKEAFQTSLDEHRSSHARECLFKELKKKQERISSQEQQKDKLQKRRFAFPPRQHHASPIRVLPIQGNKNKRELFQKATSMQLMEKNGAKTTRKTISAEAFLEEVKQKQAPMIEFKQEPPKYSKRACWDMTMIENPEASKTSTSTKSLVVNGDKPKSKQSISSLDVKHFRNAEEDALVSKNKEPVSKQPAKKLESSLTPFRGARNTLFESLVLDEHKRNTKQDSTSSVASVASDNPTKRFNTKAPDSRQSLRSTRSFRSSRGRRFSRTIISTCSIENDPNLETIKPKLTTTSNDFHQTVTVSVPSSIKMCDQSINKGSGSKCQRTTPLWDSLTTLTDSSDDSSVGIVEVQISPKSNFPEKKETPTQLQFCNDFQTG